MALDEPYRALLAVSEAIVSHRDLSTLFQELAGRLHHVVRFDYLVLFLHEAASNTLCLHVVETSEPALYNDDTPLGRTRCLCCLPITKRSVFTKPLTR
jgi:hypothetical protein